MLISAIESPTDPAAKQIATNRMFIERIPKAFLVDLAVVTLSRIGNGAILNEMECQIQKI